LCCCWTAPTRDDALRRLGIADAVAVEGSVAVVESTADDGGAVKAVVCMNSADVTEESFDPPAAAAPPPPLL